MYFLELQEEKLLFITAIRKEEYKNKTTVDFWLTYSSKFKHLGSLALCLCNISAAAALIERKFSQASCICTQRRGNMSCDQIKKRVMLKTNMPLLEDLNEGNKMRKEATKK